ncbi:hypothetical protein HDU85_007832 [Gaertneriomyces sp. JEL0708]|nr:hypothetical protein HDU85_007832 [Gaertneriomyces sp. JEL0708]
MPGSWGSDNSTLVEDTGYESGEVVKPSCGVLRKKANHWMPKKQADDSSSDDVSEPVSDSDFMDVDNNIDKDDENYGSITVQCLDGTAITFRFNYVEQVDENRLQKLLKCKTDLFPDQKGKHADLKKTLKRYIKNCKTARKSRYNVSYDYGAEAFTEHGRLYPQHNTGMTVFPSMVRNYLANGRYYDVDMVNCMPTITLGLAERYNLSCDNLGVFVNNREATMKRYKFSKEQLHIALHYHTNKKTGKLERPKNQFIRGIWEFMYGPLLTALQEDNAWSPLWNDIKKTRNQNKKGTFISLVHQTYENAALRKMVLFLEARDFKVDTLIHDGCLVQKHAMKPLTQDTLDECSVHLKQELGFNIKLITKPMDVDPEFVQRVDQGQSEDDAEECLEDNSSLRDFIRSLPGREEFDCLAFFSPTHLSAARWFMSLKKNTLMKHESDIVYVLGRDNIWRSGKKVEDTDLRIQVSDVLLRDCELLIEQIKQSEEYNNNQIVQSLNESRSRLRVLLQTASFSNAVVNYMLSECPVDSRCIQKLQSKPHLLPFTDCVYDLLTGERRPAEPEDYVVYTTGYPFPTHSNPLIRKEIEDFFTSIFATKELRDYRIAVIARALYGELKEEIFFVLKGTGRNGKGVEDTLIQATFGEFYTYISSKNLTRCADEPDKPNSQMYGLFLRRYISTSETSPGTKFRSEELKPITGRDPFKVRTLHSKHIAFVVHAILNIQTNDNIQFDKVDRGTVCRLRVLEFPHEFGRVVYVVEEMEGRNDDEEDEDDDKVKIKPENLNLKHLMGSAPYRDEFMLMLLDVFKNVVLPNNMEVIPPPVVSEFSNSLLAHSLTAADWFNSTCILTGNPNDRIKRSQLYERYAESVGQVKAGNKTKFYDELRVITNERVIRGARYFVGIKYRNVIESSSDTEM